MKNPKARERAQHAFETLVQASRPSPGTRPRPAPVSRAAHPRRTR
jgi:hypothetical protein